MSDSRNPTIHYSSQQLEELIEEDGAHADLSDLTTDVIGTQAFDYGATIVRGVVAGATSYAT